LYLIHQTISVICCVFAFDPYSIISIACLLRRGTAENISLVP